jgi:hypothetical protein
VTDKSFIISRKDLAPVFQNPRTLVQFQEFQRAVAETIDTTGASVDATTALQDATFVTLSPNADLTNEFIFQVGEGLRLEAGDGVVNLFLDAGIAISGHAVRFVTTGDTTLALPLDGVVATREWINAPAFTDDTAAAAGGVAVGEIYRKVDKLAARMT